MASMLIDQINLLMNMLCHVQQNLFYFYVYESQQKHNIVTKSDLLIRKNFGAQIDNLSKKKCLIKAVDDRNTQEKP